MKKNSLFFSRKGMTLCASSLFFSSLLFLGSCESRPSYDFKKAEDAFAVYDKFFEKVRKMDKVNLTSLTTTLNEWEELNDTVRNFLMKDSTFLRDLQVAERYFTSQDSVRTHMLRLSEGGSYDYADVMTVKRNTSSYMKDKELKESVEKFEPFFMALDETKVQPSSKEKVLASYRKFLSDAKKKGFNSTEDFLSFIKQEDVCFRSFLLHMDELGEESVDDITRSTEIVSQHIFRAAAEGKLDAREAVAVMSMRTVRRLLLNAHHCLDYIESGAGKKNEKKSASYLWMVMQPFTTIDKVALATFTGKDQESLNLLMERMKKSEPFAKAFDSNLKNLNESLPKQIMKLYILSF